MNIRRVACLILFATIAVGFGNSLLAQCCGTANYQPVYQPAPVFAAPVYSQPVYNYSRCCPSQTYSIYPSYHSGQSVFVPSNPGTWATSEMTVPMGTTTPMILSAPMTSGLMQTKSGLPGREFLKSIRIEVQLVDDKSDSPQVFVINQMCWEPCYSDCLREGKSQAVCCRRCCDGCQLSPLQQ